MLEEKVKKILARSGWFENRKIDITNQIKILEGAGYEVFDVSRKFMEEFGELNIIAKYIDSFGEEDYDEHTSQISEMGYLKNSKKVMENYYEKVGEKIIPICKLYNGEYIVCISESGKFFVSEGMWAENIDDFWNGTLGEYQGAFLDWIDYKAGKEIQCSKYKNKDYF
ncbi:SUKH-3 domain-containing protein [Clostridium sporogenes]